MGVKSRVRMERSIHRIEYDSGAVSYRVYVSKHIGVYSSLEDAKNAKADALAALMAKKDARKAETAARNAAKKAENDARKHADKMQKEADRADDDHCMSCVYHWICNDNVCCEYILRTGHSRGCPPGLFCDKYLKGSKDRCLRKFGDREWPDLEIIRKVANGKR